MKQHSDANLPTYKKTMLQAVAYKRIRSAVNTVLHRFDLNATQWMILGVLYESATGLRITDIAHSLEVEVPLITRLAQALRKDGLVQRKLSSKDKRIRPLSLTDHGKEVVADVEQQLGRRMSELERGLDSQTAAGYFHSLELLTQTEPGPAS